jgi:hypothetical protein
LDLLPFLVEVNSFLSPSSTTTPWNTYSTPAITVTPVLANHSLFVSSIVIWLKCNPLCFTYIPDLMWSNNNEYFPQIECSPPIQWPGAIGDAHSPLSPVKVVDAAAEIRDLLTNGFSFQ